LSHRIDLDWATARRTLQILQQSFFHVLVRSLRQRWYYCISFGG
jgi:hypothetical protein